MFTIIVHYYCILLLYTLIVCYHCVLSVLSLYNIKRLGTWGWAFFWRQTPLLAELAHRSVRTQSFCRKSNIWRKLVIFRVHQDVHLFSPRTRVTFLPHSLTTTNPSPPDSLWPSCSIAEGLKLSTRVFSTARKLLVRVICRVSVEWIPISVKGGKFSGQTKPSFSSDASKFGERMAEPSSFREFAW